MPRPTDVIHYFKSRFISQTYEQKYLSTRQISLTTKQEAYWYACALMSAADEFWSD